MKNSYKPREAAELAGVTVRTLHHYDRIGLLQPTGRTQAGYRLYSQGDLLRLQHIAVFKFIGLSLKEIRELLRKAPTDIREALLLHRTLLLDRKKQINDAVRVIEMAEQRGYDLQSLLQSMEALRMSERKEWMKEYYSPEALAKISNYAKQLAPQMQEEGQRKWKELIAEVEEAAATETPESSRAQELAAQWQELIRGFTHDDPDISAGLNRLYADRKNWPADFKRPYSDRAGQFISQACEFLNGSKA